MILRRITEHVKAQNWFAVWGFHFHNMPATAHPGESRDPVNAKLLDSGFRRNERRWLVIHTKYIISQAKQRAAP